MKKKARQQLKLEKQLKTVCKDPLLIQDESITGINPNEYIPMADVVDPNMINPKLQASINNEFARLSEKINYQVDKEFKKVIAKNPKLDGVECGRFIDRIAASFESTIEVDGATIRFMPMIQLFARSPREVDVIYKYFQAKGMERVRLNEFISCKTCEIFQCVLFDTTVETDTVPVLVAIIENDYTDPRLYTKQNIYYEGN